MSENPTRSSTKLILTPEQFAFMERHHEALSQCFYVNAIVTDHDQDEDYIDVMVASEEWKHLFGDMCFDDALDRFESTPGYDPSIRIAWKRNLAEDLRSGKAEARIRKKPKGTTTYDRVAQVLNGFAPQMTFWAGCFLLPADQDLVRRFIAEAEEAGMLLGGVVLWFYSEIHNRPFKDARYTLEAAPHIRYRLDNVAQRANIMRDFLENSLADDHAYVSFLTDVPGEWVSKILAEINRSQDTS